MKQYLWIHIVLQTFAGLLFYFKPELLTAGTNLSSDSEVFAGLYGLLCCFFGLSYLFINLHMDEKNQGYLYLYLLAMGFHLVISFQCYGLATAGHFPNMGASYTHAAVFAILTFGYLRHRFDTNSLQQ